MPRRVLGSVLAVVVLVLTGCAIPADPDGTLERIDAGTVRVGASPSGELVTIDATAVSGSLADLITGFARERGSEVSWTIGSEEELVSGLEEGTLDLAIGGMTDQTPWSDRVSVTRGFRGVAGAGDAAIVVLLPMGENATQSALEAYLDEELSQ